MATSMVTAGPALAGTEMPPPLTGADTSFQGIGNVATGSATIVQTPTLDTITVSSARTVINFTPFDTANGGGPITFLPSGRTGLFVNDPNSGVTNFTVLNRIVPTDTTRAIRFDGTVQSRIADAMGGTVPGGTILFYSPGGIIASATSVFDVGSLVLSAADINLGATENMFQFSGAAAGTAVDINSGALILAQGAGSYVALVAPRVIQSGTVKSDGSVGYFGAEAVDVTIQNNLFDINFVQGTDGGAAVTHNGSTELTRAPGDTAPQRIYVAAVPKNDAITTLISGSLGYTAATEATMQNGTVILSAGRNVGAAGFTDYAGSTAAANISIGAETGTIFNSSVVASATGDALIAPATGTTVEFANDVSLSADRLAEVRAVAGSSAVFGANLTVNSNNLLEGSAARVIATGETGYGQRGSIGVGGNLTIDGGSGSSALAELAADLGSVSVTGSTLVAATDDKSFGIGGDGNATGGTAKARVGAVGSQLTLTTLSLEARALAGIGLDQNEVPVPGNAMGGTSSLMMGGGTLNATTISLDSGATATPGGLATGGTVTLLATGGTAHVGTITTNVGAALTSAQPNRDGPVSAFTTGEAAISTVTGGTIQLDVTDTTVNVNGDLILDASAATNDGNGGARGGTININVDNGSLLVGDTVNATASARESASALGVNPAAVRGGTISTSVINSGTILASAMSFDANAESGGDAFGGAVSLTVGSGGSLGSTGAISLGATSVVRGLEAGGNAIGGNLTVNIGGGGVQSGPLILDATAVGGDAVLGNAGGSATGGTAQVNMSGGDSTIEKFSLTTDATGGRGGLGDGMTPVGGVGGTATGGVAEVNLTGGALRTAGFVVTSGALGGTGGDAATGGDGGAALGGRAALLTSEAASLFLMQLPTDPAPTPLASSINSSARGGEGGFGGMGNGGAGGIATGGTSLLTLATANIQPATTPFAVDLRANSEADGGRGGSSNGANGGVGGGATGGTATINLINNNVNFGSVALSTRGSGGSGGNGVNSGYGTLANGGAGGNGRGGASSVSISAPAASVVATNVANLAVAAEAAGGNGGVGGNGGAGGNAFNTGSAQFTHSGGAVTISVATLTANSFGGNGGLGLGGNGGIGGNSQSGTSRLTADGAAANLMVNVAGLTAIARGGFGGDAQANSGTVGGNAGTALGGTSEILATNGALLTLTVTAATDSSAFGGLGGIGLAGGGAGGNATGGHSLVDGTGGRLHASLLSLSGDAVGGTGGQAGYGGPADAAATGGSGGSGTGGGAALRDVRFISTDAGADVTADGVGGSGGSGPNGGNGGNGTGGSGSFVSTNLTSTIGAILVSSVATGGMGGAGSGAFGSLGGNGGMASANMAQVIVDGGSVTAESITARADAFAGSGGFGYLAGSGGNALGGAATFSSLAGATVQTGALSLDADAEGGIGGLAADGVGDSMIAGAIDGGDGGKGGSGTAGTVALTSSGAATSLTAMVLATDSIGSGGRGGNGGAGGVNIDNMVGAGGDGGAGGIGTGGTVNVAINGGTASFVSGGKGPVTIAASGLGAAGGIGGEGSMAGLNGVAGNAAGGAGTVAVNAAQLNVPNLRFNSDGRGPGNVAGGSATFNVTNGATYTGDQLVLTADAMVSGPRSGDMVAPIGSNAAMMGIANATGGAVAVNIDGGTTTLAVGLELAANAEADLGTAMGGSVSLIATGGTLTTPSTLINANGSSVVAGTEIGGRGGSITIRGAAATNGTAGILNLGSLDLEASGFSTLADGSEAMTNAAAGRISIAASGGATSAVNVSALSARALGRNAGPFNPNAGIFLDANLGGIFSNGAVTLLSDEGISIAAMGTGRLFVGNDLNAEALNTISISHSGRAAGANTLLAGAANFIAGNDFSATTGSLIRSDNDLLIRSTLGAVGADQIVAGDDISINANTSVNLTGLALTTGIAAMGGSSDISIVAPGAVSVNMIDAAGNFSVSADSFTANGLISAGEDVSLSTAGAITTQAISAGDDVMATSVGGNISVTSAIARGTGPDTDMRGADVRLESTNGTISLNSAMSHDDIFLTSLGNITASNLTASGTGGLGNRKGIIVDSASTAMLTNISSDNSIAVRGASVTATQFAAGEDIALLASNGLSATTATAGDDFMATSAAGTVTLSGIATNGTGPDDRTTDFGNGGIGFVATAADGSRIDATATSGNIVLASLTSAGATSLSASGSVTGGTASAGGLLTVNASSLTAANLTSRNDSVMVTAGSSTVTTGSAALDLVISTGMAPSGSITLGTAVAGRDIDLSSLTGSVSVTNATAGDDIAVDTAGSISSTGLVRTTGAQANGSDSDIELLAGGTINLVDVDAFTDFTIGGATPSVSVANASAGDDIFVNVGGSVSSSTLLRTTGLQANGGDSDITLLTSGTVNLANVEAFTDFSIEGASPSVSVANASAGDDIFFDVTGTVNSATLLRTTGAQANGGDSDIEIFADGAVTVNAANAFSDFEVNAASVSGTMLEAGEDVELTAVGNASAMSISTGDDTVIRSTMGNITVGSATARGTGPDDEVGGSDVRLRATGGTIDVGTAVAGDEVDLAASGMIQATSLTSAGINPDDDLSNVMVDSGAGVTLGTVNADATIAIRAASLTATSLTAGEDIAVLTSGAAAVTAASAGDDVDVTSTGGAITLGSVTTTGLGADSRRVSFIPGSIEFGDETFERSNILVNAAGDLSVTSANAFDTLGLRSDSALMAGTVVAGEDATFASSGATTLMSVMAGDDIDTTAGGAITIRSAWSTGMGADDRKVLLPGGSAVFVAENLTRSNIVALSGSNVTLGNLPSAAMPEISAAATLAVRSAGTISGSNVAAGEDIALSANSAITVGAASAGDDFTASAETGDITLGTISARGTGSDDRNVVFGEGPINFLATPTDGSQIDVNTDEGDVSFMSLNSGGTTNIMAGGSVLGGMSTAGGLLSVMADIIDVDSLTSTGSSVSASARSVDIGTASAGVDVLIDTKALANSNITLGTATAARDIRLTGGTNGITATSLTAGADIDVMGGGSVSITNALTTGSFNEGYGESISDITVDAASGVTIGTARAKDNLSVTSVSGTTANMLTADRGDILVNGGTLADVMTATATLGTATLTADMVDATTVTAGSDINIAATGDAIFSTLNSGGATNIMAGGSVLGGMSTAGGLLSVMADIIDVDSLTSTGSSVIASARSVDIGTASAALDIFVDTKALANSNITLGTAAAARDIRLTGGTNGINADSLVAGADIDVIGSGNVSISNALTTGSFNEGYGDTTSDIIIDATNVATLGSINSSASLAVRAASLTGDILTGGEDVAVLTSGAASINVAFARDDLVVTSTGGAITLGSGLTIGGGANNRRVSFVPGSIGFGAETFALSNILLNAAGDLSVTDATAFSTLGLRSGSTLTAGTLVAGEDATSASSGATTVMSVIAGDDIDVTAGGAITVRSARSTGMGADGRKLLLPVGSAVFVGETLARSNIVAFSGSNVTLGNPPSAAMPQISAAATLAVRAAGTISGSNVTAGEDIAFSATGAIAVSTARAGDDFTAMSSGSVTLDNATASGTGSDLRTVNFGNSSIGFTTTSPDGSNIVVTAPSALIVNARALDNITLTTTVGTTATWLTADRGNILVNGGDAVDIMTANATLGSVTLDADTVDATTVGAGTDVNVNFGTNAQLGSLTAGHDVNVTGTGDATIGSASAMRDFVTMVDGDVTIMSASAGRNLRNTSANLSATTLNAGTDVVVLTDATASLGSATAGARIVTNAGSSIDFTRLMSGTTTSLVAGTSVAGGDATAGTTLSINANGGTVGFGMLSSGAGTTITASSAISGNFATAGGALTLNSGANGITALSLTSGIGNNVTVTASNGGNAMITTATSGNDLSVNATNVSVSSGSAARDAIYTAANDVTAGGTTAGRDILFSAGRNIVSGTASATNRIVANSVGDARLTTSTADNIFVVTTGNATFDTANAATMLGVSAQNISGTTLRAGEDIRLIASGTANVTAATAGDDFDVNAPDGVTLGTIRATGAARDDRSLAFNAPNFEIVASAPDGSDIRVASTGAISAAIFDAGDDIRITGGNLTLTGVARTRGLGVTDTGSDVVITGNAITVAIVDATSNLSVNSTSFDGTALAANGTINVLTSENQSLGSARAVAGPITGTSTRGNVNFFDLSTNGDINLNAGNMVVGSVANAGGSIQLNGARGVTFSSLVSGGTTSVSGGGNNIIGGTIDADGLIALDSDTIILGSATSNFDSIFLSGRDITVGTADARFDFTVDTRKPANSRIALGDVNVGRDILLLGATNGLTATTLLAGDDIDIDIIGNTKIGLAMTDGSFNGGYGDDGYGDPGYGDVTRPINEGDIGPDLSNITLNAAQAMIGTARATDNVTLTTITGTMADNLVADRGDILVNGGTSANIMNATATLGSVTIDADAVSAVNVNAATDVDVTFGESATLGTVVAGNALSVVGDEDATFTSLTSGDTTTIMAGGSVLGGTSTAGGLLSVMADSVDVDNLTSSGNDVVASARSVNIGATSAARDALIDTKDLANSNITLGSVVAARDVRLTGGTNGISAMSLTAGDDIDALGSSSVSVTNALTSGTIEGDASNITLTAATRAMLGTIRAKDNLTVTTTTGTTAANLTADRGAIVVDGGTSANITRTTATLGSVAITADAVTAANLNAATSLDVNFGASATLGTAEAGSAINAAGTGSLAYSSLTSGTATTLAAGGTISGGTASAGTNFTATPTGSFSATGATVATGLVAVTATNIATANITSGTTTTLTASQGALSTGNVNAGTGVTLRASDTVVTGALAATANNVAVTAANGMTVGSASAANDVVLTNGSNLLTTGALSAGNDISVTGDGAIDLASASAADDVRVTGAAAVTLGVISTRGGADIDGDGNDIAVRATGPIALTSATTQTGALASSDVSLISTAGAINAGSVTARGIVSGSAATALVVGTATAGANIALTGQTINATALTAATNIAATSNGAMMIGDARSTGGNLSLTAAGALSATSAAALGDVRLTTSNGGGITTGTLTSGSAFTGGTTGGMPGAGDIVIASDGSATMTGNTNAGRNLAVTARNPISVGGVANGLAIDLKSSDIVINPTAGRIGEQGRTTQVQLTNSGTGTTTIGGTGASTGFSLSNAEAQRIFAGDVIITATAPAPDVVLDALTLTGANGQTGATGGNIGSTGRLRIEAPGKLRTIGAVAISNLATANRLQLNAAQSIEVDTATGSISLTGAAATPGGAIELTAPTVVAGSQAAIASITTVADGRALNDSLAINDGAISDAGAFTANSIVVNVSNGFFVQNSGIKELSAFSFGDRRGVTLGSGGLTINAASPTTRIFFSGRQLQTNGSFITGVDFLRQQTINGTRIQLSTFPPTPFDPASTINGCAIINSAACLINVDGGSLARDVVGQSDEDSGGSGSSNSSSDANFVQFQFKNLDEANFQTVVDDPVTGVGNDDLWALYDAKACADDQSLESCGQPK